MKIFRRRFSSEKKCIFVTRDHGGGDDTGGENAVFPSWVFPKIGVPQNRLFIMEIPIKLDDLGVPLFLETPSLT